jgi:hypothetical protein
MHRGFTGPGPKTAKASAKQTGFCKRLSLHKHTTKEGFWQDIPKKNTFLRILCATSLKITDNKRRYKLDLFDNANLRFEVSEQLFKGDFKISDFETAP